MKLQGRNLALNLLGEDVALLHSELSQLNYVVSDAEKLRKFFGPVTREIILEFQKVHGLPTTGVVDEQTAALLNAEVDRLRFVVQGQVRQADGSALPGITVVAVDRDLRGEETLGRANTDQNGHYEIRYTSNQFARAEKGTADLIARVLDAAGSILAASPTVFNAPQTATIDIVVSRAIPGSPSEYEQLVSKLAPLLVNVKPAGVADPTTIDQLADLKADDLDFLVGETDEERSGLAFLATAAALQKQAIGQDLNIPAAAFYGLAREGLPLDLAALYRHSSQEHRNALEQALQNNIIPAVLRESLDKMLEQLQRLLVQYALQTPPAEGRHSLGELLTLSALAPAQQASLLALYVHHDGPVEAFWQKLRENPDFQTPGMVNRIQLTLQLGVLTQNHVPLIRALQETHHPTTPRDLATLDTAAWTALVNRVGAPADVPGETPEEKVTNYVRGTVGLLQAAFPTDVVAQIVVQAPDIQLDTATRQGVAQFFANAPDLDLGVTHVDTYVTQHADTIFREIPVSARTAVVDAAKRLQRVFRVSTGPETVTALLGSRYDSASAIAQTPRATFIEQMQAQLGGEHAAHQVYAKAQFVHATTLHLYTQLYQAQFDVTPGIMAPGLVTGTLATPPLTLAAPRMATATLLDTAEEIKLPPTWAQLFNTVDLCDCAHCRSVLSPAAYFVDLLHLLGNSLPNQNAQSPLDVLLLRRPDLAHIQLTCENTNTPLPYIDLVNEILESYVVLGHLDATVAKDTGDSTADELSASPQYTNDDAYDKLRLADYPLTLPYTQPVEVARVYLEHLGSRRDQVMQLFRQDDTPPTLRAIDAEYLQIAPEEYQVLTTFDFDDTLTLGSSGPVVKTLQAKLNAAGANPALHETGSFDASTQAAVQVFQQSHAINPATGTVDAATWTALLTAQPDNLADKLTRVPQFLQQTGISYPDLVELVKTRFVNPHQYVLAFIEPIKITYEELKHLVDTNFMNVSPAVQKALADANVTLTDLAVWAKANFALAQKVIVLVAPPEAQCDLNVTTMQYLDGTLLPDPTWRQIITFIRLWRKLGWSMSDLDQTITALQATDITPALLQELAQVARVQAALRVPLVQIASLWATIETHGDHSLYSKLFLSKAAQRLDANFRLNAAGSELAATGLIINEHIPAILAALRISEADLELIRTDAKLAGQQAPLTLESLSHLYHYVVLTKALRLKIKDLIALKTLAGIDPFSTPDQTLQCVDIVHKLPLSGFSIAQLNYLYRHLSEPPTSLAPQRASLLLLAKTLREGLIKITADNVVAADPAGELTRQKLGLLFESPIVDQTVRMIDGSAIYTAALDKLPDGIARFNTAHTAILGLDYSQIPAGLQHKISYDPPGKVLRFTGPMTDAEQQTLDGLLVALGVPPDNKFNAAVDALYKQPRNFNKDTLSGFLALQEAEAKLLEKPSLDQDGQPILLDAEYPADGQPVTDPTQAKTTASAAKFAYLLDKLLPYLRDKLSHSLVKQTVSEALQLESTSAELLLETVLHSHVDPKKPAVNDLLALSTTGLTAAYVLTNDTVITQIIPTIAFDGKGATPETKLPDNTKSAQWTGMLLAPNNDTYTFSLSSDGTLQLWVDNQLIADQGTMALKAGQLYDLRVEYVKGGAGAIAELRWQSPTMPKDLIPSSNLYPGSVLDTFAATFTRLDKAALLVNGFKLTTSEIAYLSAHRGDFAHFTLQDVPLDRSDLQVDQKAVGLFKQWQRLQAFVTLRNSLPKGDLGLVDLFGFAATGADKRQLRRTTIQHLATALGQNPAFVNVLAAWLPAAAWTPPGLPEAEIKSAIKLLLTIDWTRLSDTEIQHLLTDPTPPPLVTVADPDNSPPTLPPGLSNLLHVLAKLDGTQMLTLLLGAVSGWDPKDLAYLSGPQGFKLTTAAFTDEIALTRLHACVQLIRRLGLAAEKLFHWATQPPNPAQAQDIKNTVKAKYDDETWLTVAKPLSDTLRERQKAALIAYVLTIPTIMKADITTSNQLFEYFLLDVDMSACMATSRIKQAISSVQTFVQRCFMNLEAGVPTDVIRADYWAWMQHYRIWEANRKVFLYPENWIEAELRDDKTPFFKDLESELLQNDLTMDTAETAFLNYLEKLDEVARLDICGMYWEQEPESAPGKNDGINHLHVFGRTFHTRHVYYYRRLENNTQWTPWDKVLVDIEKAIT